MDNLKERVKASVQKALEEKTGLDGLTTEIESIIKSDRRDTLHKIKLKNDFDIALKDYKYQQAFRDGYRSAINELRTLKLNLAHD